MSSKIPIREKLEAENLRLQQEVNELKDRLASAKEQTPLATAGELDRYFNDSLDLLCIADTDGYFRRVSREWETTLGYSIEELKDQRFLDFVHPEDKEATLRAVADLKTQKEVLNFVNRYRRKNGGYRWIEWRSYSSGKVIYAVARDITERKSVEQALRESEDRFTSFMRHLPGFAYLKDHNRRILYVNEKFESDFGIPTEDWIGKTNDEIWPGDVGESIKRDDLNVLLTGEPLVTTEDVPTRGELHTFRTIKFPIPRPEGQSWLGGVSVDITNQQATEMALRKSESMTRSIIESIPIGMHMYLLDSGDRLVFEGANPAADKILGVNNSLFVGKTIEEAFPALTVTEVPQRYREAAGLGKSWHSDMIFYREGGIEGAYEVYAFQIAPHRMAAAFSEITERRKAEKALRDSEYLLRKSQEVGILGSYSFDSVTGKWIGSPMLDQIFGIDAGYLKNVDGWIGLVHPDERNDMRKYLLEHVLERHHRFDKEYRIIRFGDGQTRWVHGLGELEFDAQGRAVKMIGTIQDITKRMGDISERNKLQEQLQQAMKMEAVGRLSGGVAHDFNNLLTVISGNLELSKMELSPSDPLFRNLDEAAKAANSAASLTRQLLAFSRRQIIEPKVLNLNDLIENVKKMLGRLIGEDIELQTDLNENLGSVKIDPGQFEQVLVNLAVNARDAMPSGGRLLVETRNVERDEAFALLHPDVKPGNYVRLGMTDTGQGMSNEVKEHIFEPFFTTKQSGHGTGLGLATTFGAVQQAGGTIEVLSEMGAGTTFNIYLPIIEKPAEKLAAEKTSLDEAKGEGTVLLVEDDSSVRNLAVMILKKLGYNVLQARSGDEAFLLAEKHFGRIDLLMTDVVMPGMNGRELAQALLKLQPRINVLFTSGYTDDRIMQHGVIDEKVNFIAKPYSLQLLAQKVREILNPGQK